MMHCRLSVLAAFVVLSAGDPAAAQPAPHVAVQGGNITYTGADGVTRTLTTGGHFSDPALSPDGHTVAFLHEEHQQTDTDEAVSSLWIADGLTGHAHSTKQAGDYSAPVFSLNGGFVYVTDDIQSMDNPVYQVNVVTGQSRHVTNSSYATISVIQTGPYSGDLRVEQSRIDNPGVTKRYAQVYIIRPDGKILKAIPGTRQY